MRLVILLGFALTVSMAQAAPYYTDTQILQAKAEAKEKKLPIAWISVMPYNLDGTGEEILGTQLMRMALKELPGHAVVILSSENEGRVPLMVHNYLYMRDDPDVPAPHTHFVPKIIFTDPTLTKYFERVSYTDMKQSGAGALYAALNKIAANPANQAAIDSPVPAPDLVAPGTLTLTADDPTPAAADDEFYGYHFPYWMRWTLGGLVVFLVLRALMGSRNE